MLPPTALLLIGAGLFIFGAILQFGLRLSQLGHVVGDASLLFFGGMLLLSAKSWSLPGRPHPARWARRMAAATALTGMAAMAASLLDLGRDALLMTDIVTLIPLALILWRGRALGAFRRRRKSAYR